jgi:predicted RNA-binding Zn-ribbon protein involved in translation (DUF1610 family)
MVRTSPAGYDLFDVLAAEAEFDCPNCGQLQVFVIVPQDAFGADEDDYACVVCGSAVIVNPARSVPSSLRSAA